VLGVLFFDKNVREVESLVMTLLDHAHVLLLDGAAHPSTELSSYRGIGYTHVA
jgi:hypothetical protein